MLKNGSKFLYSLAAVGFVAAIVHAGATGGNKVGVDTLTGPLTFGYKGYVGEHTGYALLIGVAIVSLSLGVFLSALRDADPEAGARALGLETVPVAEAPPGANYWPVVAAFSLAAVALGLAIGSAMFIIGLIGLVAATIEWASYAWADRATGDPEANRRLRSGLMNPFEIPAIGVLAVLGMILGVSRILLAVPAVGALVLFGLVPAIILALGAFIVLRPNLSPSVIAGFVVGGALLLLAGGVAAAIVGERDHGHDEEHPTEHEAGALSLPPSAVIKIQVGN